MLLSEFVQIGTFKLNHDYQTGSLRQNPRNWDNDKLKLK